MDDSILLTIKRMLGIADELNEFNGELIPLINSELMVLEQIGVGTDGFAITGPAETWEDFLPTIMWYQSVKTYLYARVKLLFDPPTSTVAADALKSMAEELTWRMNVKAENA